MIDAPENEQLVARFLGEMDRASDEAPPTDVHPDEEMLSLFALGELRGREREELVGHLSRCAECRRTASAVMTWAGVREAGSSQRASTMTMGSLKRPAAWLVVGLAAAACVLVTVGILVRGNVRIRPSGISEPEAYAQAAELLGRGKFDEARAVATAAEGRGFGSDRLRSVQAQALRRMSGMIALAFAGRLTDFGFEMGGAVARSTTSGAGASQAEEALKVLGQAGPDDDSAVLNRGHALLSLGRASEALAEFQRVAGRKPDSALAQLGQGLAFFALSKYAAAEGAFRACLKTDPHLAAARTNLAMTLTEEGKIDEALAAWSDVLSSPHGLPDTDRQAVEQVIQELRNARPAAPAQPKGAAK